MSRTLRMTRFLKETGLAAGGFDQDQGSWAWVRPWC